MYIALRWICVKLCRSPTRQTARDLDLDLDLELERRWNCNCMGYGSMGSVRARSSARTRLWLEHNIRYTTRGLRLRVDDKCTYRVNRAHRVMGVKISALRVMIIMEGDMGDMLQHSKNILEIVQCGDLQLLCNRYMSEATRTTSRYTGIF